MQARLAATKQITESLEPGTRAGIFTTSGQHTLEFTDDRDALVKALNSIIPTPGRPGNLQECPDIGYYQADLIINQNDPQALAEAEGEWAICNPPPSNMPASALPQYMAQSVPIVRQYALTALNFGDRDTRVALDTLKAVVRRHVDASRQPHRRSGLARILSDPSITGKSRPTLWTRRSARM